MTFYRYVLVDTNDVEGEHEYTDYDGAVRAAGTNHAVCRRSYIYDDSELVWTPGDSDTWPPTNEEENEGEAAEPTQDQLLDEDGVEVVQRTSDPSWRHGTYETVVYHREDDDTYWEVNYRLSTDGETHELREGLHTVAQVYPRQKVVTVYVPAGSREDDKT